MIGIGKYKFGWASLSMVAVLIVLSACAIITAFRHARPEYPMPMSSLIFINEGLALLATLVYGIILHFAIALRDKKRKKNS